MSREQREPSRGPWRADGFPLEVDGEGEGPYRPGVLSLDLRSLALFRVALAAVVICDLISCIPEIGAFYTDDGIMPRDALVAKFSTPVMISLHLVDGWWGTQLCLTLITVAALFGMLVGYRTGLSTFIAWLMICSLHNRNGMILHGGDDLIRVLLFWSMFAPLNCRWSLDRLLNPGSPPLENDNYSWGTQALMLQLCFVYWFTAAWKWDPVWTSEGSAIYYALSLDQFVKPLGKFLLHYPELMKVMTHGTFALELLGPFLLFIPVWNARLRLLVVASFIALHSGIGLTMALGTFSWVCIAAWLMFLPAPFWEFLQRRMALRSGRLARLTGAAATRLRAMFAGVAPPPAPRGTLGPVSSAIVLVCALIVFGGSLGALPRMQIRLPMPVARVAVTAQLGQRWAMFAPYPSRDDGWYITAGALKNGKVVDVWNGGVPSEVKPADVAATFRDSKWRKYLTNLWLKSNRAHRPYLALYLCRAWNTRHMGPEELQSITIYYMLEETPPPSQPLPTPQKVELWRQKCSDPPPNN